ncbi:AdoMet-homocysteine methyltransferase [Tulasnella sp. 417]|nr:AdoMet-homocysteine methyltransferase [Tulasnella sp. 417]
MAATFETPSISSSARQRPDHKLCLSLGPYGAMLPYAQEFDAIYPPPFGPCAFDPRSTTVQTNSFILHPPRTTEKDTISIPSSSIRSEEHASHLALTDFHLRRLRVYAEDERTWSRIDLVAFETTPLLREAKAIREAVARLQSDMYDRCGGSWTMKPWYISFVFPGGNCPEERWVGGPKYNVRTIVETAFLADTETSSASSAWAASTNMPCGVGVNCTEPKYLPGLVKEMSETLRSLDFKRSGGASAPWLVVYPNGGTQYDIVHRTWIDQSSSPADIWADEVLQAIGSGITSESKVSSEGEGDASPPEEADSCVPWAGILIGGCCKASPAHIAALANRLHPAKGTSLRDRGERDAAEVRSEIPNVFLFALLIRWTARSISESLLAG